MVTGQYAFHHGLFTNRPPLGGYDRLNNTNTLPVWLQRAGYRTAYIGKYINALPEGTIPPGYDDWQAISATARHYYGGTINDNGTTVTYSNQEANYITDVLARRAVATIDRLVKAGSPFYLSVGATAPHIGVDNVPPTPAPRHDGLYAAEIDAAQHRLQREGRLRQARLRASQTTARRRRHRHHRGPLARGDGVALGRR